MKKRKLIALDDHQIILTGIKLICKIEFPEFEVDTFNNSNDFLNQLKHKSYDLAILDINIPNSDAHNLIFNIIQQHPKMKILIFSMCPEDLFLRRYFKYGIHGYLAKDSPKDELIKAITDILDDKKYISSKGIEILTRDTDLTSDLNIISKLSDREFEIFTHLIRGNDLSEISQSTNLHKSTIGTHKKHIFEKLKVKNILELKQLADTLKLNDIPLPS